MFPESTLRIKTRLKPISGAIELTPLIDVLFLLLIFFIVASSFIQVWGINVSLPETEHRSAWGVGKNVITVQADGMIFFNDHPVNIEGLKRNLQNLHNSHVPSIILRADEKTHYAQVVNIISLASTYEIVTLLSTSTPTKTAKVPDENFSVQE